MHLSAARTARISRVSTRALSPVATAAASSKTVSRVTSSPQAMILAFLYLNPPPLAPKAMLAAQVKVPKVSRLLVMNLLPVQRML
jgi:hypothetical protein